MQRPAPTAATRRPQSLQAEAQARATETFKRRMAELAALAPQLARLDELRPALEERGCTLYTDNILLQTEHLGAGYAGPRSKVLRLITTSWADKSKPGRFITALLELGFKTLSTNPGPYGSALLRKGTLLLRVDLADPDVAPITKAAPLPATSVHCAAGQLAATAAAHPGKTVICTTDADGQPLPGGYAMAPAQAAQHTEQVAA